MNRELSVKFESVKSNDGTGYFVRATWSDGSENQITGFINDTEARAWIVSDSRGWLEWMPHRVLAGR
jgi:hypothetical protein